MAYDFAVNKTKLTQSVKALNDAKKLNPAIEVTEETVREEYIKRGGLIREKTVSVKNEDEEAEETTVSSKRGRKAKNEDEE